MGKNHEQLTAYGKLQIDTLVNTVYFVWQPVARLAQHIYIIHTYKNITLILTIYTMQ